jgi:hypothetical protein
MNLEQAFQRQQTQIEEYEREYKLPDMLGSDRQRPWARIIRKEFLSELLPQVMDATRNLSPEGAQAVYASLGRLRAENRSKHWIESCRPHQGAAVAFLLALPEAEALASKKASAAAEAIKVRQEKSRQAIRDIKIAGQFEDQHSLVVIVGEGLGVKQANYGRRCRYWMLKDMSADEISEIRGLLEQLTRAATWINAFQSGQTISDMIRRDRESDAQAEMLSKHAS